MWLPLLVVLGLLLLYRWYRQSQILENITDKYVFITGCDSGFGKKVAKQLDNRGMKVLAACLTNKGASELKEECSNRLQTVILDVSDSQSVSSAAAWVNGIVADKGKQRDWLEHQGFHTKEAIQRAQETFSYKYMVQQEHIRNMTFWGLWGLVNNAGILIPMAPNEWLTREDFRKVLEVNLLGMVDVTINLLPLIRKSHGRIVNVSSIAGRVTLCGGGYCLSKYGVEAFSDSLRRELKPFGVKVSIINPDFFRTSILISEVIKDRVTDIWKKLPLNLKNAYGEKYYEQYCGFIDKICSMTNPKITVVTDCMEHALTAVHPWTRYSAGWYAKLIYMPLTYLPACVADSFLDSSPDLPK